MRAPSLRVIVPLVLVAWILAMLTSGRPGAVAHATDGQRGWDAGRAAAVYAEGDNSDDDDADNMAADDDGDNVDADDDADNMDADADNDESNNSNSNDNRGTVTVVPVSVPAPAVSAPPPPVDEVSQCLANGGTLVYHGPEAGIAVKSFQDNLNVTLTRINPTSQPAPPGVLVGSYTFRLSASPCGGAPYSVLPTEANLAITYSDALAAGRDESRFALMRYDGTTWTVAPKLFRDAASNHVSASVTGLGVYALVQQ
jgi:hypothetical protein